MKYKVTKAFVDKETMIPYNAGYDYDTTDKDRAAELQEGGYIGAPLSKAKKAADDGKGTADEGKGTADEGKTPTNGTPDKNK